MRIYDTETGETHAIDVFSRSRERAERYGDRFVLPSIFHYLSTIYELAENGRVRIIPDD